MRKWNIEELLTVNSKTMRDYFLVSCIFWLRPGSHFLSSSGIP